MVIFTEFLHEGKGNSELAVLIDGGRGGENDVMGTMMMFPK
jgi:hypothetical protein